MKNVTILFKVISNVLFSNTLKIGILDDYKQFIKINTKCTINNI